MNKRARPNEYFTLDGLAFQTVGNALELAISIRAALDVVHRYCAGAERGDDCDRALVFLESHVAKIRPFAQAIRETYHLDDFTDQEAKAAKCQPAIKAIWCRMENKNL